MESFNKRDKCDLKNLTNHDMGYVFEQLIRRFNESVNENPGEHYTPRDAISILVKIVASLDEDLARGNVLALLDSAKNQVINLEGPRNITVKEVAETVNKHFDGIVSLRKTLEEALNHTDDFGRDARSIMRTLENIKTPDSVEKQNKETKVDKIKSFNK